MSQSKEWVGLVEWTNMINFSKKVFDSMDEYTLQQYLNVFLQQQKIKFSDLIELTKEIGQGKLVKDLTPQEKQLIDSYINK